MQGLHGDLSAACHYYSNNRPRDCIRALIKIGAEMEFLVNCNKAELTCQEGGRQTDSDKVDEIGKDVKVLRDQMRDAMKMLEQLTGARASQ
eukprot:g11773.t1